jgi:prepilin-type N-terminal cleavage/methylation domain-containing protein
VISRRPGYTLFELILTTAVIAITAAVTVPSLDSMYPSYKLNASVDAIRAAWAQGRAHAIEEGRPYRFAVVPGGSNYQLGPDENVADGAMPSDNDQTQNGQRPFTLKEQLPQGVTFVSAQEDGQQSQSSSSDGLSTVAVFLPDGTARDDAAIRLQVPGTAPKSVKLRALTGAVTVQQQDGGGTR